MPYILSIIKKPFAYFLKYVLNVFYETSNKSMKNWLFFPQGYVQMIFILLTKWKI